MLPERNRTASATFDDKSGPTFTFAPSKSRILSKSSLVSTNRRLRCLSSTWLSRSLCSGKMALTFSHRPVSGVMPAPPSSFGQATR